MINLNLLLFQEILYVGRSESNARPIYFHGNYKRYKEHNNTI